MADDDAVLDFYARRAQKLLSSGKRWGNEQRGFLHALSRSRLPINSNRIAHLQRLEKAAKASS